MCPKRFVDVDVHKPPGFEIPSVYKMEVGKALHAMFQDEALNLETAALAKAVGEEIPERYAEAVDLYIRKMYRMDALKSDKSLLWAPPRLTDPVLIEKLKTSWPEVPVHDLESGISGRADLILNDDDSPCVLDLKTTSVKPDLWESFTSKPISKAHELQVGLYAHLMNKYEYYDKKITKIGLGYINLLMPPGEENSEYEVYITYTEKMDNDIAELIKHLKIQRDAYMKEGVTVECTYPRCKAHTSKEE